MIGILLTYLIIKTIIKQLFQIEVYEKYIYDVSSVAIHEIRPATTVRWASISYCSLLII